MLPTEKFMKKNALEPFEIVPLAFCSILFITQFSDFASQLSNGDEDDHSLNVFLSRLFIAQFHLSE